MKIRFAFFVALIVGCLASEGSLQAAEGGSGVYLLGLRSSGAGITPPPGVFFSNQIYTYKGSLAGRVELGGGVLAAQVDADVTVNIPTLIWVTDIEMLGARLGFSATAPYGRAHVSGVVSPLMISASDSVTTFGDPAVASFLGWNSGKFHIQSGVAAYLPIGDYTNGALANIARHRLAADFYTAITWLNPDWGIDISNTVGLTFNAKNRATGYKTGTEFHWEGAVSKQLTDRFTAGIVGYYYRQISADRPPGAIAPILGDFKGEVAAIGAQISYNFNVGKIPVATRLRYYHQFGATNHLKGDALFFTLNMPLALH